MSYYKQELVGPVRYLRLFILISFTGLLVTACAKPPKNDALQSQVTSFAPRSNHPIPDVKTPKNLAELKVASSSLSNALSGISTGSTGLRPGGRLSGRTIWIDEISDIRLKPGEVVLTFDDGPHPTRTPKILGTLKQYGVKATFLMVGQMAQAHPQTAQKVVKAGHSIGTHTYGHTNLAQLNRTDAYSRILKGARAVARAILPTGGKVAPFFRFPYLAQTTNLRKDLANHDLVILDVDIDSRDYRSLAPAVIQRRTMAALRTKGKGIILFHDIQPRTVAGLPGFLQQLKDEGFKVVHLAHKGSNRFNTEVASSL